MARVLGVCLGLMILPAFAAGCVRNDGPCSRLIFDSHLPTIQAGNAISIGIALDNCSDEPLAFPPRHCRMVEAMLPRVVLFGEEYLLGFAQSALHPSSPCDPEWAAYEPVAEIIVDPHSFVNANVLWDGSYRNVTDDTPVPVAPGNYTLVAHVATAFASSRVEVIE